MWQPKNPNMERNFWYGKDGAQFKVANIDNTGSWQKEIRGVWGKIGNYVAGGLTIQIQIEVGKTFDMPKMEHIFRSQTSTTHDEKKDGRVWDKTGNYVIARCQTIQCFKLCPGGPTLPKHHRLCVGTNWWPFPGHFESFPLFIAMH